MKEARSFLDHLIQLHKYKLKGDEPLSFHLAVILAVILMGCATINQRNM